MASFAYQRLSSIASTRALDSQLQKKALEAITPQVDADLGSFLAGKPNSPCFTAGSTKQPTLKQRMQAPPFKCSHVAWLKHGGPGINSTYGGHYRNEHGHIEESNLHVVARAPGNILGSIEDAVRETLRANPLQSKQQNSASDTTYDKVGKAEDLGIAYVIAAPDGDRDVFLKADKKHKSLLALHTWCVDPKNKNKKADDYKPQTATITNDVSAIETVIILLDAGWSSETLRFIFRGAVVAKGPKKVIDTMLRQKDDCGDETLMATTWRAYFPACGPTGNKFNIVRDNVEAAVMAFELRTSTTEAPSVSAQRALDIVKGASSSTALPAPLKRNGHVQNVFTSSGTCDSNKKQKTSGGGGASAGTNPHEPGAAAPAASSSSAGAGAGADSGASAGSAICIG